MSIADGVAANAANFNAAFLSRTQNSTTVGIPTLANTSDPNSGSTVVNPQRAINELFDADGTAGEGDSARKNYSSNNYIADGDSRKTALEKLDAALALVAGAATSNLPPEVEIRALSAPEIAAFQLTLASTPSSPTVVIFDVKGYPTQFLGLDYTVAGNVIDWSGLPLASTLIAGDIVRITYWTGVGPQVENRSITAGENTAKQLSLVLTPAAAGKTLFSVQGLPEQYFGYDFNVTGNTLSWNGLGLDGILTTGMNVRIIYWI